MLNVRLFDIFQELCAFVPLCLCAFVPLCLCASVPLCLCAFVPLCLCAFVPLCLCASVPLCLLYKSCGARPPTSLSNLALQYFRQRLPCAGES
jgi:hypothetical protein